MTINKNKRLTRRTALFTGAASSLNLWVNPGFSQEFEDDQPKTVKRNASSFKVEPWQKHFDNLKHGAILCDTASRALQYWSEDLSIYKLFPTSVPATEELTRLGTTKIIRKVVGPSWRPTPSMKERNPEWPDYWPPGPDNPLGTHALYLSWQYTVFMAQEIRAKLGVNLRTVVLVFIMSRFRNCLILQK